MPASLSGLITRQVVLLAALVSILAVGFAGCGFWLTFQRAKHLHQKTVLAGLKPWVAQFAATTDSFTLEQKLQPQLAGLGVKSIYLIAQEYEVSLKNVDSHSESCFFLFCSSLPIEHTFFFAGYNLPEVRVYAVLDNSNFQTLPMTIAAVFSLFALFLSAVAYFFSRKITRLTDIGFERLAEVMAATSLAGRRNQKDKTDFAEVNRLVKVLFERDLIIEAQKETLVRSETRQELSRELQKFAHDIRSPLSFIRVFSQSSESKQKENAFLLKAATERIDRLAESALKSFRDGVQKKSADASVDFVKDVEMLLKQFEIYLADKRIEFSVKAEPSIVVSRYENFDPIRAMSNLINNSVEASATRIEISIEDTPSFIEARIQDNGSGMCELTQFKVMKYDVSVKSSNSSSGSGLGLASLRDALFRIGGEFEINSHLGKGTLVCMKLPKSVSA